MVSVRVVAALAYNDASSDFDLHEYRHYYLAENWKISKRVRKTHQLSPSRSYTAESNGAIFVV